MCGTPEKLHVSWPPALFYVGPGGSAFGLAGTNNERHHPIHKASARPSQRPLAERHTTLTFPVLSPIYFSRARVVAMNQSV